MTSQAMPPNTCALEPWRAVLDLTPQPMWICDSRMSRFLDVNEAALLRYGYSRQEFLSMPVDAFGQTFDAGTRTRVIPFEGGDAILVVARDTPAERRAEEILATSYALGRLFSQNVDDTADSVLRGALSCLCKSVEFAAAELWTLDDDGKFLSCAASWLEPGLEPSVGAPAGSRVRVETPDSILAWVLADCKPCWTRGIATEPGYAERAAALKSAGITAGTAFGVRSASAVDGVVVLLGRHRRPPDPLATQLLVETGVQLGSWLERRRVAEEILTAENTFRSFFDDAPFPYHETDSNGVVVRVNKAECRLLGLEASEIIGRPVWDFVTPEERKVSRATMLGYINKRRTPAPFERTRRTSNGESLFRVHARLMTSPSGVVTGVRTVMLDLSEASRARQQIEFQTNLLDQVNDAVVTVDRDFWITYCNASAERLFGWPDRTALGRQYKVVAGTKVTQAQRQAIHAEILGRGAWNGEIICTNKQGAQFLVHVTWSVFRDQKGNPIGAVGIHRDVTAPKQMEQDLRASQDRLKLAQSMLALGTWEADLNTGMVECSEQLVRMYGLPDRREPFPLQEWHNLIHPDDRPPEAVNMATFFQNGETIDRQFRVLRPDGTVRWLHTKALAVFDEQNQPVRVIGVDFDITEHKQTEERLRILSSAVEQCPVSILITNLRGEIEYVNARLTESTGYTLEDLRGLNPAILSSEDTPVAQFDQITEGIRSGEWRGINHTRRKNGELYWESAVVRCIRDAHGNPTHRLGVAEDITERLEMEAALKLSEERFRIAADCSGDTIFEWDLRSDLITLANIHQHDASSFGARALRRAREFRERFHHPEDRARLEAAIQRTIETGEPYRQEFRMVLPTGEVRHYSEQGSVVRDASGKAYKWIGVGRDVTEQRKVERANAELAAIVECADVAIISEDLNRCVLTWNRGAERMYGYTAGEMVGHSMEGLIPPERRAEDAANMEQLRRGESVNHRDTTRLRKSGEPIPVLLTLSPIRDRNGTFFAIAHVAEDITHVKQLERQLAQTQKLESIGQLAAGIAHEINTPIQYIGDNGKFLDDAFRDLVKAAETGRTQVLEDGTFDYLRGEVPKAIEQLLEGVDHVARIVRAMKEFSHPGPVEKTPLNINRAIESTALVSRSEWKYVARLTENFDPELPPVPCLAGELNQVILNLIVNAAHAISDVVGDSGERGEIHISTRRDGQFAEIRISDTGCGIPPSIQPKIFDPFFTTKPVGKGTGQGLAIAHSVIVQKHGGTIHFESEPGRGTTFTIRLPYEYDLEAA